MRELPEMLQTMRMIHSNGVTLDEHTITLEMVERDLEHTGWLQPDWIDSDMLSH